MKKPQPVAIVATGKVLQSFILDLPGFRERIGPVKASSLRVASRITNTMQAGFPVASYDDLSASPMMFLCVPDELLPKTIKELGDSPLDWAGRAIILCDSPLASDALHDLAVCGAYTASINLAPGPERMVLTDGHRAAISYLKPLIGRAARLIRILPEQKSRYCHALATASLCGPLAALAAEQFRASGLTPAQAKPVVQSIFLEAVRDYLKSGRKVLSNSDDPESTAVLLKALGMPIAEPSDLQRLASGRAAETRDGPVQE